MLRPRVELLPGRRVQLLTLQSLHWYHTAPGTTRDEGALERIHQRLRHECCGELYDTNVAGRPGGLVVTLECY